MKIGLLQMDIVWHDRRANYAAARTLAREAVEQGAQLLVLPELFSTGFSMETAMVAEAMDGPTPAFLRSLAAEHGVAVIGGFGLNRLPHLPCNVALAVDGSGNDAGVYAKNRLIGLLHEDRHFAAGHGARTFELAGCRTGLAICYDLRFPELFLPLAADAALIVVIASWPASRQAHWQVLLAARAIENQVYVAGVNRVGRGGGLDFAGGSMVVDPLGNVVAQAQGEASVLLADIDPGMVAQVRYDLPFLQDRLRGAGS